MADIRVYERVRRPQAVFRDRRNAGLRLVEFLDLIPQPHAVVFALPRGGVPVAEPICEALEAPMELALVRKLPVPWSPEVGFGAVAIDGTRLLNHHLLDHFSLSQSQIDSVTKAVLEEVRRRATEYLGEYRPPAVQGKDVYLVDDGLATGFTMMAAAKMIRQLNPRSVILSVPVSPWDSLMAVMPYFDTVRVLYVQERAPFAVASYYQDFPDLSDVEVREILKRLREALSV
jgi:putative phosphoribosyl transferase